MVIILGKSENGEGAVHPVMGRAAGQQTERAGARSNLNSPAPRRLNAEGNHPKIGPCAGGSLGTLCLGTAELRANWEEDGREARRQQRLPGGMDTCTALEAEGEGGCGGGRGTKTLHELACDGREVTAQAPELPT